MQTLTEELIQAGGSRRVLSHAQVARLLKGTPQRRYNLVNRALRRGELLRLRRGLYVVSPVWQGQTPHPFVLAQAMQPGSYVSFETALSFHGWIPESAATTLSVTPERRRLQVDHAVFGLFRFFPLALHRPYSLEGVERVAFAGQTSLVAQPLRALTDILCLRNLEGDEVQALPESMRIDSERLRRLKPAAWRAVERAYARPRTSAAIRELREAAS